MDPALDFVGLELRTECPRCSSVLPLDRPERNVTCGSCGSDVDVARPVFEAALESPGLDVFRLGRGVMQDGHRQHEGRDVFWKRGRDAPVCPVCGGPTTPSEDFTRFLCSDHGEQGSIEKPPDWFSDLDSSIEGVVTTEAAAKVEEKAKKVALECKNCGSSLSTDGSSRAVPCEYCDTTNVIPADVWEALHPPSLPVRWWVALSLPWDPRRETPSASEEIRDSLGTLGCVVIMFLPVVFVVVAAFGALHGWLVKTFGQTGFWIFAAVLGALLVGLVIYCVPYLRRYIRWKKLWKPENEVVGRLGEVMHSVGENTIVKVNLTPAGEPENVLTEHVHMLDRDTFDRLGGSGGLVRAWMLADRPWLVEIKNEPTALE